MNDPVRTAPAASSFSSRARRHAMLAIGLLQGLALWALATAHEHLSWPANDPVVFWALTYFACALPLTWYLTEAIDDLSCRRRATIAGGVALVLTALGAYDIWVQTYDGATHVSPGFAHLLGCAVLGFSAVPLLIHARREMPSPESAAPSALNLTARQTRHGLGWSYPALFQTAWRNAVMLAVAVALTGVFWIVLWAGALLMGSIGLPFVRHLIVRPVFIYPVSMVALAAAFVLALTRSDLIVSLRRFWLSMNQIFLPLLLFFGVMWVVALPFAGLSTLLATRHAAFILLWFTALAVKFTNAAHQDGLSAAPFTPALRRIMAAAWLAVPIIVAVAAWALYQRINQHGWTQTRVWGALATLLAAGYSLGYAISLRQGRRGWFWSVDRSNVAMALLLCAGLIALLSPIADARRIAVGSQLARLARGAIGPHDFDYGYLSNQAGRYGRNALRRLAQGGLGVGAQSAQIAAAARAALDSPSGFTASRALLADADARSRWRMLPDGATIEPGAVDAVLQWLHASDRRENDRLCLRAMSRCALWQVDLDGDGTLEIVLISSYDTWGQGLILEKNGGTGALRLAGRFTGINTDVVQAIAQNRATLQTPRWKDLEIGHRILRVQAEH